MQQPTSSQNAPLPHIPRSVGMLEQKPESLHRQIMTSPFRILVLRRKRLRRFEDKILMLLQIPAQPVRITCMADLVSVVVVGFNVAIGFVSTCTTRILVDCNIELAGAAGGACACDSDGFGDGSGDGDGREEVEGEEGGEEEEEVHGCIGGGLWILFRLVMENRVAYVDLEYLSCDLEAGEVRKLDGINPPRPGVNSDGQRCLIST